MSDDDPETELNMQLHTFQFPTRNEARSVYSALRDRGHRVALDTPTNNVIVANDEPLRLVRESAKGRKKLVVELTDKTQQGVLFIGADDAPGQEYLFG